MPRRRTALAIAIPLLATAPAPAQQVDELIDTNVVRSFASQSAKTNAEASVALVNDPPSIGVPPASFGPLPSFSVQNNLQTVTVPVEPGTNLYATGFVAGPMERTGRRVEYYNLDNFAWNDGSNRNYQTHPWVLAVRADGSAWGVLFDSTWYSSLDTERPLTDGIIFQAEGASPRVITINGASPQEVVMKLAEITGYPFMPPMWSTGYHQSKYSYTPQTNALAIALEFRNRSIPAEVIWMDIDYMDGFRNFTFNPSTFWNPAQLNSQLDAINFQGVWMANCGIKVDNGYFAYDEMVAGDYATKQANQFSDYIADVWPGASVWPDFTMASTRNWWASRIALFASIGVDGIWNDMNEPAVFNVASKTMPDNNWHRADMDLGGPDIHRRYHNIYGMQMSRATQAGLLQANPNKRPFVLTRAGYIGGQRYAAMWTGDNIANWYHVDVSIQNILNIGMSGQPNCGPDIGGFNGDAGGDHYQRWMGMGALMPFARGHYGFSSIDREPWSYGTDTEDTSRLALNRRYRLLNHIYTQFYYAHTTGLPVARPLFFAEPANPDLREWDNGFLIGDGLLVVGATTPGAIPQVPPTQTPLYRLDFNQTNSPASARDSLDPDLPDLYVLAGSIIPTNEIVQHSRTLSDTRSEPIELIVALDENGNATGTLYEDDGDSYDYQNGDFVLYRFNASTTAGNTTINISQEAGSDAPQARTWSVRLLTGNYAYAVGAAFGSLPVINVSAPTITPDSQPDPNDRDGRLIDERFTDLNLFAESDAPRWSEISQLRALYAQATPTGIEIGIEGELAIDGTAMALFIDSRDNGQNSINTSSLNPPPAGLNALTGIVMDSGFAPDHMLFMNGFDGSVFTDFITLNSGGNGSKTYLGRQFIGSDSAILSAGTNPEGIEVALGSAGPAAGSGFEIFLPYSAIGDGVGDLNQIKLFAAIVKGSGEITSQTLPQSSDWPGFAPNFDSIPGTQFVTLLANPDLNGDGVFTIEDLHHLYQFPSDVNNDGLTNDEDFRFVREYLRRTELQLITTSR